MNVMHSIRLAFFVSVLLCAAAAHAAITGTVVDQRGAPLAGASVRLFAQETRYELLTRLAAGTLEREPLASATTGTDGTFRVVVPERAVAEVVVSAPGHEFVAFEAAATDDAGTLMLAEAKPIAGHVTAAGKPVADAIVIAGEGAFAVRTGEDGSWSLPRNATNTRVVVLHRDFAPFEKFVGTESSLDVTLDRGAEIRGKVVAPNGRTPAARATIIGGAWTIGATDAEGSFIIPHARSNWKSIRIASPLGGAIVAKSTAKSYDVHLRKPGSVTGIVRDTKTHAPVPGFRIRLAVITDRAVEETIISNAKGEFAFRGMAPGRYDIHGEHPLYSLDANDMMENLGVGEDDAADMAASPLAIIRGRAIDETKKPLAGVAVTNAGSTTLPKLSAADGTFILRIAADPSLDLQATRDGYATELLKVVAVAGESSNVVITMRRGVRVAISVVDGDRKPVADAQLRFADPGSPAWSRRQLKPCGAKDCVSGKDGAIEARVAQGTYDIYVEGAAIVSKVLTATVIDERSSPMTITVTRGLEVSGRATFSDGTPAAGAMVLIQRGGNFNPLRVNPDGTFSMHNAPPQPLTLDAEMPDARIPGDAKEVTPPAAGVELTVRRGGRIAGRVVDATSREPIIDFNIYVRRNQQMSRAAIPFQADDGAFVIENVTPGNVELQVVAIGHARATASGIEVEESKTASGVELKMERAARVKGRITSADGQPISGATAYVKETSEQMNRVTDRVISDANGLYELGSVLPGERTIRFIKDGFKRDEKSVDAAAGKETRLDVQLERGRAVSGRVVNERGEPVGETDLAAEGMMYQSTRSDAAGAFHLEGLGEGKLRIRAHKEGYAPAYADLEPGVNDNVTLTMRRGATINGHVSGLTADQLRSVNIWANAATGMNASTTVVGTGGTFTLTGFSDGMAIVSANHDGRSVDKRIEIVNGVAPDVELTFVDGFTIRGRVTVQGRPLPAVFVRFDPRKEGASPANGRTGGDGAYEVRGVAAGEYQVSIAAGYNGSIISEQRTISGPGTQDFDVKATTLRGRVFDARTMSPLADAHIAIDRGQDPSFGNQTATSDSDGRFALEYVAAGSHTLNVEAEGYMSGRKQVTVGDSPADVEVQLVPGAATMIHILDAESGQPVVAYFSLSSAANTIVSSGQSRLEDGIGRAWVAPGSYTIRTYTNGYAPATATITVPGPEPRVPMWRAGRMIVTTHTPGMVRITSGSVSQTSVMKTFDNLLPGEYVVELLGADEKVTARKTAVVRASETTTLTFD
ncbi:MAG: hypothetical protein JWO97_2972 [Acidobacteria bacterium]|nr:hypothetical protein [Acidobacteriota bacterium]